MKSNAFMLEVMKKTAAIKKGANFQPGAKLDRQRF